MGGKIRSLPVETLTYFYHAFSPPSQIPKLSFPSIELKYSVREQVSNPLISSRGRLAYYLLYLESPS
jgi:hypothetical protein